MRNINFQIILLLLMLSLGCFKFQDHEVVGPGWPRYDVGGAVLDYVTSEPVNGCIVTIERGDLYFEQDDFRSAGDTTDSDGIFRIDSVPPGVGHSINLEIEDYCIYTGLIDMNFSDALDYMYLLVKIADAPRITVSNSFFSVELKIGNAADHILTIFNNGTTLDLNWNLTGDGGWIIVSPKSGSVSPQGSQDIDLHFDTSGIQMDGIYRRELYISSNDCNKPVTKILARLWAK